MQMFCSPSPLASLAWFAFLVGASGQVSNKAQWRGQPNRQAVKARAETPVIKNRSPLENFRFLDSATKPYQVTSLLGVAYDIGEMYSGLVPVDERNKSRALFFVFQPTIGPPVDEINNLVKWRTCSLEGFFQENGRFLWQSGQFAPELNPYSWVNLTNMLWVEQPVGTGFSIGEITATSEKDNAQDFVNFFLNFQNLFSIQNFKIYVTGESYAGRYVPYISTAMIDRNDKTHFDLSGVLTYDPCIGATDYTQQEAVAVPFVLENSNVFGLNESFIEQITALDKSCGYAEYREKHFTFPPPGIQAAEFYNYSIPHEAECDVWDDIYYAASAVNPCFNMYLIVDTCPIPPDVLGFPGSVEITTPGLPIYFDRADSLPQVIEHTNRVLVANGDLDFVIITNGTLLAIQNMTWNGKLGFQEKPSAPIIITEPDLQYEGTVGVQHYERGLMWAETYLSGHMEPEYQPRTSYRHIQWVLGRINQL
ncbi:alpha/beta-hydrolase [Hyaloscypha variabilis F]|uniref:Carboxypeptidase n=1 Tax=Hyaloscypha variabilis (strain UAMH 11265 / GT02V1 / F) TaxID=1149755 RepID=A0A2J6S7V5_HYAVF|nr:alpha/beta-hydrolase [Hyaloscypha variabilis F]